MKLFVFSASLRRESLNARLARLIARIARNGGHEVDLARIGEFDMPFYDFDVQQESGIPAAAAALADRMTAADGMVLCSPEYNWLPPAAVKNAVDWLSRIQPMPLAGLSLLLAAASPSPVGGARGLMSLRTSFEALGVWVYPKTFALAQAGSAFDGDDGLADPDLAKMLEALTMDYCSGAAALANR